MLWRSCEETPWARRWARYDAVVQSMQKRELAELDAWYLVSLPPLLRKREPEPHVTKKELQQVMKWKLKKGKWRPQLMTFITGLSEDEVEKASRTAFRELKSGDLHAATDALSVLKGVGPATASAVLAAYDESVPFMADEALEAIANIIGPRKYTLQHFLKFTKELRAKAKWLNEQRAAKENGQAGATEWWTAQRVQLCLYAEAHDKAVTASDSNGKKKTAASSKRKLNQSNCDAVPTSGKGVDELQTLRRNQRKRQRPAV
ncbi:hypothetical protein PsorP6_001129 [Peronosclerospora sorghi]|uniref:Uncharacterized protein n=1 Tax=Peronosclerospora sorghi TaxID=230839 RepID=A0ACC0WSE6_9STRA|nr:hypothetical protein PsorP6_001129 [Peronosclerospora sorghi]